jgi:quinol monooxygenase YgiN
MICMTVTFTVQPEHMQAAMKLLRDLVKHGQTEPGMVHIQVYRSQREPRHFFASLQFDDEGEVNAHQSSAYYGEFVMTNLYGMLEGDGLTIETYSPLFKQT